MAEDSSPKQENMVSDSGDSAVARLLLATSMAQQDLLTDPDNATDSNSTSVSEAADTAMPISLTVNAHIPSTQNNTSRSTLDINHNLPLQEVPPVSSLPRYSPHDYSSHRSPSPSTPSSSPPVLTSEGNYDGSRSLINDGDTVTNFLSMGSLGQSSDTGSHLHHDNDASYMLPDSSPDDEIPDDVVNGLPNRFYRCRFCNFSAPTYTQLQLHMPKHGGLKALKCPLCDYSTNDKSNFRRHRRLHLGNNPVSVLKCGKCPYSTILPRKFREHYNQVHHERIAPHYSVQTSQPATYISNQTYSNPAYTIGQMDLNPSQTNPPAQNANMSATSALHSLLTGIHTQPVAYNHAVNQPIAGQCVNQYGSFLTRPTRRQVDQESHLASNYLRSIVSSIMNSPIPTQVAPATASTMPSSGFYFSPNIESVQQISPQTSTYPRGRTYCYQPKAQHEVKVKIEPPDCDSTPHVSSSAAIHRCPSLDDIHRQVEARDVQNSFANSQARTVTVENNEASTSVDVERTNSTGSVSSPNGRTSSVDNTVNTTVKSESLNVGVQCSFPMIKSENCVIEGYNRTVRLLNQGVQCEILAGGGRRQQQLNSGDTNMEDQQSCVMVENRCCHCGIVFEDEVLFSIHIGCHSHTDPFVCNVCGKQCGNKYGFYSHIMRGHNVK